eukprot:3410620-Pyramimonas_sp.AAC.1
MIEQALTALDHRVERFGARVTCLSCGAYSISQGRNRKLEARCVGPSSAASIRSNQEQAISRMMRQRHPRT